MVFTNHLLKKGSVAGHVNVAVNILVLWPKKLFVCVTQFASVSIIVSQLCAFAQ